MAKWAISYENGDEEIIIGPFSDYDKAYAAKEKREALGYHCTDPYLVSNSFREPHSGRFL